MIVSHHMAFRHTHTREFVALAYTGIRGSREAAGGALRATRAGARAGRRGKFSQARV